MTAPANKQHAEFDFEYWRNLAKSDPEGFERERRAMIASVIDNAPSDRLQQRLRRLQWRIDLERERSGSALGACIRIYNMMWASMNKNYELMQSLVATVDPSYGKRGEAVHKARVLPFKRQASS